MLAKQLRQRNACRERAHGNRAESVSGRTDKRIIAMAHLVDEIDWQHCLQCNNNNWDDCVEYAMKAAECGEIGCEYLKFK